MAAEAEAAREARAKVILTFVKPIKKSFGKENRNGVGQPLVKQTSD
jgi:hypothetical protein